MADAVGVVKKMQTVAVSAVEATKPVNVCFGKVLGVSPLQIEVEQKMILGASHLIVLKRMTDYSIDMTMPGEGKKKVTVHNSLAVGEKVILLRQQKGQKFVVWDRIGGGST